MGDQPGLVTTIGSSPFGTEQRLTLGQSARILPIVPLVSSSLSGSLRCVLQAVHKRHVNGT